MPTEGVVAIGLLSAVALTAASAERRRRRALATGSGAAGASLAGELPRLGSRPPTPPAGLPESWERNVHDDETVGTIDYKPPPERPS